jgi:hypothetical protein
MKDPAAAKAPGASSMVSLPQIAYSYSYAFRLPSSSLSLVQETHLTLCDQLGPARCRVEKMERSASQGNYTGATLTLQVAAPIARAFGDRLVAAATGNGAETIERGITGEDLSKQIVDTDARIRTKEALINRLTELLRTRSGNIEQAVQAERAVNDAQEELERARAEITEMRGRVAMSAIEIQYQSSARLGGGFTEPLRDSFGMIGFLFAQSLSLLITAIAALLPWALVAGAGWWIWKRAVPRLRRGRLPRNEDSDPVQSEIDGSGAA